MLPNALYYKNIKSKMETSPWPQYNLCKSTFYILVPKAVNQRVQHGDDHGVEHRCNFVSIHGLTGSGLQAHWYDCPPKVETAVKCEAQVERTLRYPELECIFSMLVKMNV